MIYIAVEILDWTSLESLMKAEARFPLGNFGLASIVRNSTPAHVGNSLED
jgi:hypothetical protein